MTSILMTIGFVDANADETSPTPVPTQSKNVDTNKQAKIAEKAAQKAAKDKAKADYLAAKNAYIAAKKAVNTKFKSAVKTAKENYKTANSGNLTPEQKSQITSARDAAIAAATATRDSEMAALGSAPVKPAK